MDQPALSLMNGISIILTLASLVIFLQVLASSKSIDFVYRPYIRIIALSLVVFSLEEFAELFDAHLAANILAIITMLILIYALNGKIKLIIRNEYS